jgi:hypothetical protein
LRTKQRLKKKDSADIERVRETGKLNGEIGSASRDQKQMFLIVGHLAKPLSEAAFASAAARSW